MTWAAFIRRKRRKKIIGIVETFNIQQFDFSLIFSVCFLWIARFRRKTWKEKKRIVAFVNICRAVELCLSLFSNSLIFKFKFELNHWHNGEKKNRFFFTFRCVFLIGFRVNIETWQLFRFRFRFRFFFRFKHSKTYFDFISKLNTSVFDLRDFLPPLHHDPFRMYCSFSVLNFSCTTWLHDSMQPYYV